MAKSTAKTPKLNSSTSLSSDHGGLNTFSVLSRCNSFSSCSNDSSVYSGSSIQTRFRSAKPAINHTSNVRKRSRNSSGSSLSSNISCISDKDVKSSGIISDTSSKTEVNNCISIDTETPHLNHTKVNSSNGRIKKAEAVVNKKLGHSEKNSLVVLPNRHNLRGKITKKGCTCCPASHTTVVLRHYKKYEKTVISRRQSKGKTVISSTRVKTYIQKNSTDPPQLSEENHEISSDKSKTRKRRSEIEKLYASLHEINWAKNFSPDNILRQFNVRQAASCSAFGRSPDHISESHEKIIKKQKVSNSVSPIKLTKLKTISEHSEPRNCNIVSDMNKDTCMVANCDNEQKVTDVQTTEATASDICHCEQDYQSSNSLSSVNITSSSVSHIVKEVDVNSMKSVHTESLVTDNGTDYSDDAQLSYMSDESSSAVSSSIVNIQSKHLLDLNYKNKNNKSLSETDFSEYSTTPTFFDIAEEGIRTIDACFREVGAEVVVSTCYDQVKDSSLPLLTSVRENKISSKVLEDPPVLEPCIEFNCNENAELIENPNDPVEIDDDPLEIDNDPVEIDNNPVKIDDSRVEIGDSHVEIDDSRVEIDDSRVEIDDSPVEIDDSRVEIETKSTVENCSELPISNCSQTEKHESKDFHSNNCDCQNCIGLSNFKTGHAFSKLQRKIAQKIVNKYLKQSWSKTHLKHLLKHKRKQSIRDKNKSDTQFYNVSMCSQVRETNNSVILSSTSKSGIISYKSPDKKTNNVIFHQITDTEYTGESNDGTLFHSTENSSFLHDDGKVSKYPAEIRKETVISQTQSSNSQSQSRSITTIVSTKIESDTRIHKEHITRPIVLSSEYKSIRVNRSYKFTHIILLVTRGKSIFLTLETLRELRDAIIRTNSDPKCQVLVINGVGDSFCLGLDLKPLVGPRKKIASTEIAIAVKELVEALSDFKKPLAAVVNGPAYGLGMTLLNHADLAIASDKATFCMPHSNLGYMPEGGATLTLPQIVGSTVAMDLLLRGKILTAREACNVGLITEVLEARRLPHELVSRVQLLVENSLCALETTKALLKMQLHVNLRLVLENEVKLLPRMWLTRPCQDSLRRALASGILSE